FHTLVLADGTRVPMTTETIYRYGEAPGNSSATKIGGGAVLGAILGAIAGGAKGAAIGATAGAGAGTAATAIGARSAEPLPPSAGPAIKSLGRSSTSDLRQASEQGANVEGEGVAAKAVGLNYYTIPFTAPAPDPDLVPTSLAAVTAPANQPAFIHCAGGGRAA